MWPRYYYLTKECDCLTWSPDRVIYLTIQVVLFYFCPILIITYTFAIVAWTLWRRKLPGEQTDSSLLMQQKSRRKVRKLYIYCVV